MSKPTCTIQAWLWQSQSFFCVFFPLNYFVQRKGKKKSNGDCYTVIRTLCVFFFVCSLHRWKMISLSLLAVGVSNFILFDYLWVLHVCKLFETRFMGLLKFMTIAFIVCRACIVSKTRIIRRTKKNAADLEMFALELDRWYNDKNRMPLEMYVFKNVQTIP